MAREGLGCLLDSSGEHRGRKKMTEQTMRQNVKGLRHAMEAIVRKRGDFHVALWCSGSTRDFEEVFPESSRNPGSNPGSAYLSAVDNSFGYNHLAFKLLYLS